MRILNRAIWVIAVSLAIFATETRALAEVPEIVKTIDSHLLSAMEKQDVTPASPASDAEFLRRIWLDLAGGIPTVAETRDYLSSEDPDKRQQLIERLLSSPATINHLAETWRNNMLPAGSPEQFDNSAGLHNWLRKQFSDNMRYDRIVSDLIASTGSQDDGPALFYTALELEPKKGGCCNRADILGAPNRMRRVPRPSLRRLEARRVLGLRCVLCSLTEE